MESEQEAIVKILLPVDGSENSNRAVRYALGLVKLMPTTEIRLLNVQEPLHVRHVPDRPVPEEVERHLRHLGQLATASARDLVTQAGVYTECPIEIGDVAPTIARYAKEHRCDLIVMGTRGLGPIKNLVLGSTAMKVLHVAEVPVTLVR